MKLLLTKLFFLAPILFLIHLPVIAHSSEVDSYQVKKNDFLGTISIYLYGTSKYSRKIYRWNKPIIKNRNKLKIGLILKLRKKRKLTHTEGLVAIDNLYRRKRGLAMKADREPSEPKLEPTKVAREIEAEVEVDPIAEAMKNGVLFLKQKNYNQAIQKFAEVRSKDPNNSSSYIFEITALLQMNRNDEAKVRAQELVKKDSKFCTVSLINNLIEKGDCEEN